MMKRIVLFLCVLFGALPHDTAQGATGCNYPASLDTFSDKSTGDFVSVADWNSRSCGIEKLESGPLRPNDGSATAPAYSFLNDSNTGIYRSNTDTVAVTGAGSRVAELIGQASAVNYFQVLSATTSNPVIVRTIGSDSDINMAYDVKGTGASHTFYVNGVTPVASINLTGFVNVSSIFTMMGGNAGLDAATTSYFWPNGDATATATETNAAIALPRAGTIRNIRVVTTNSQPASGSLVLTVMKNGVATGVQVTVAAAAGASTYSNTSNTQTYAGGDTMSLRITNNATDTSAQIASVAWELAN